MTTENAQEQEPPRISMSYVLGSGALTLGISFLELIFKVSVTGSFWPSVLIIASFSVCYGQLLYLLCSLSRSTLVNRCLKLGILLMLGIAFAVEFFVYQQFKALYSPATIFAGASGVASQFGGDVYKLVTAPTGILHVALFLLPAVVYGLIGLVRKKDEARQETHKGRIVHGATAFAALMVAYLLIACIDPLGELYTTRFSFEQGVQNFGLITGARKDVGRAIVPTQSTFDLQPQTSAASDENSNQDEQPDTTRKAPAASHSSSSIPEEEGPVAIEPATMDIDFEDLANSTDNATWANLDRYVASLEPSHTNEYTGLFKGYNLIFISAEAFTAEAIRPDLTPTLYSLWKYGIQLTDYYQFDNAGTTGGECANLFGLLATEGGGSVRMTANHNNYLTMGNLLNREGYNGWAFHNNTYTYYGRNTTHNNLGYNNGYMAYGNGMEQWVTWQWPESDLEMMAATFDYIYGEESPFNVYYMSVSGHNGYDPWNNAMAQKNWDAVAGLEYSDRVKGYLAANIELDRALEYLLKRLKQLGIYRKTVIVISADHFPYGLDDDGALAGLPYLSELYGYDVRNVFQRDHNRPIIWCGALPKKGLHITVDSPTSAIDLLPTLCNLFGVEWDSRLLPGRDVLDPDTEGIAFNFNYDWRTELGTYWAGSGTFEPVEGADVPEGYVEAHNTLVANKLAYCHNVLTSDYYRHVFGEPEDVQAVHDAAVAAKE